MPTTHETPQKSRFPSWATSFGHQIIASLILGIALGYVALTLGGALLLRDVQQQIRPGMKEVLEDTLADNAQALAASGVHAVNVAGGIKAWWTQIDPSMPRY